MTISDPKVIDPAIATEIAAMFRSGIPHDDIIARMRALGLYKIDSIKLVRENMKISLGEAKDIVHLSPAWADRYESDEDFHDRLEEEFELSMKEETTAA